MMDRDDIKLMVDVFKEMDISLEDDSSSFLGDRRGTIHIAVTVYGVAHCCKVTHLVTMSEKTELKEFILGVLPRAKRLKAFKKYVEIHKNEIKYDGFTELRFKDGRDVYDEFIKLIGEQK